MTRASTRHDPATAASHRARSDVAAPSADLPERAVREEWIGLVALLHELERIDPGHQVHGARDVVEREVRAPLVDRVGPLLMLLQSLEAAMEVAEPEIASICFVARSEVRAAAREAERPKASNRDILIACDVLRTRMLNALEAVLASRRKLPSDSLDRADGRAAARARSLYARLKDVLADASRAATADTTRSLGRIAVALHTMTTHDDYRDVRLSDRFVLESLYRRILAWGHPDADHDEGGRIVLDAVAMSALLETVNRRPTLRRHDRERIAELLAGLEAQEGDDYLLERLEALRGRKPELDALLDRIATNGTHPVLRRVLQQRLLEVDAELAPPPEPAAPEW